MAKRKSVKRTPIAPVIEGAETIVSPRDAVDLAEYNPRSQTTESADRLRTSLATFGLADLPVVNRRSPAKGWPKGSRPCLVGGHQRLGILDAKYGDAGYSFRHTVVDLDEPMEKALNIALNNPAMAGEYDQAKLAPILFSLQAIPSFNVQMTGFTMPEIADICVGAGMATREVKFNAKVNGADMLNEHIVIVEFTTEQEQEEFYGEMNTRGIKCRLA